MLKKAMLGIVALILLVGAENLLAKEKEEQGKPKAKQKQKQVQQDRKKQKNKAKRPRKQKAGKQTAPKREKASQKKRRQKPAKEAEAKKAKAAAARRPMQSVRRKVQQLRPGANLPAQQMFSTWLDELTNAYRENDREKMGQLIRKMRQMRQRVRKAMGAPGEAVRDFRGRPGAAPLEGMGGRGRGFQGRGMGGRGRGFQGRGMGMGQGFPGPWCPWLQDPEPEID